MEARNIARCTLRRISSHLNQHQVLLQVVLIIITIDRQVSYATNLSAISTAESNTSSLHGLMSQKAPPQPNRSKHEYLTFRLLGEQQFTIAQTQTEGPLSVGLWVVVVKVLGGGRVGFVNWGRLVRGVSARMMGRESIGKEIGKVGIQESNLVNMEHCRRLVVLVFQGTHIWRLLHPNHRLQLDGQCGWINWFLVTKAGSSSWGTRIYSWTFRLDRSLRGQVTTETNRHLSLCPIYQTDL